MSAQHEMEGRCGYCWEAGLDRKLFEKKLKTPLLGPMTAGVIATDAKR